MRMWFRSVEVLRVLAFALLAFIFCTNLVHAQCNNNNTVYPTGYNNSNIMSAYGTNSWLVTVHAVGNLQNISSSNYRGFYTQKINPAQGHGVNTTLQWAAAQNARPSGATALNSNGHTGLAYKGRCLTNQTFTFVHKRRGFPPGQYEIFVDEWDDSTVFYLDGALIVNLDQWGSGTHARKCIFLDQNSTVEIRTDNSGGGISQLKLRIVETNVTTNSISDQLICVNESISPVKIAMYNGTENVSNAFTQAEWRTSTGQLVASNTINPTLYPSGPTTYYFNGTFENCRVYDTFHITMNYPVGDTAVFGSGKWNVYGYNTNNNTVNMSQNVYYGFYTQAQVNTADLGFNTETVATGGWVNTGKPSNSNSWQGCAIQSSDRFSYVHKRQGFKCGTYKFYLDNWDSNTRIYVDGVQVHFTATSCEANCTVQSVGTFELDLDTKVELRTNENGGISRVKLRIERVTSNTLATHGEQKTCIVNGAEWVDFYAHPSGKYLGSVRGVTDDANLGHVSVTAYVDNQVQLVQACDMPQYETAVMQRHWVITPEHNQMGEVRLPYSNQEFSNLAIASVSSSSPDDLVSYPEQSSVYLSKHSGTTTVNEWATDNCLEGSTILLSHSAAGIANGNRYQDFVVESFSEFWLHGATTASPLPIVVDHYVVKCTNDKVQLSWSASLGNYLEGLYLEGSENGLDWFAIERFAAMGVGVKGFDYSTNVLTTYYRLRSNDFQGQSKIEGIVQRECSIETTDLFQVYPNPSTGQFSINYLAESTAQVEVHITDMTGKSIMIYNFSPEEGMNILKVDAQAVLAGAYIIELIETKNNVRQFERIVIQ